MSTAVRDDFPPSSTAGSRAHLLSRPVPTMQIAGSGRGVPATVNVLLLTLVDVEKGVGRGISGKSFGRAATQDCIQPGAGGNGPANPPHHRRRGVIMSDNHKPTPICPKCGQPALWVREYPKEASFLLFVHEARKTSMGFIEIKRACYVKKSGEK